MRAASVFLLTVGFVSLGAAMADEKDDKNPLKAVEGDYILVSFESKGLKLTRDELKKMPFAKREVVIKGNTLTTLFTGKKESKSISVDNSKTPHHIDLTSTNKEGKSETSHGIYKIENPGERQFLVIRGSEKGGPDARPTEFKMGDDQFQMTLRKRWELDGPYLLTGLQGKELTLTEAELKNLPEFERTVLIDDDQIITMFGGKEDPATIKIDKTKTPHHMDITKTREGATEVNYCIYKFENGVLTICGIKGEAKERPTEFKASDKTILITLKKQAK